MDILTGYPGPSALCCPAHGSSETCCSFLKIWQFSLLEANRKYATLKNDGPRYISIYLKMLHVVTK